MDIVPLTEKEKELIKTPIPVTKLYKGKGVYSCPVCGGSVFVTGSTKRGKVKVVRCSKCTLKGKIIGNSIIFSSRKSTGHTKETKPEIGNQAKNKAADATKLKNMSDQEYYEYIVHHKGTRLLPKGEHKKIMNKRKKPSGIGAKTYRKPGSIKLWS